MKYRMHFCLKEIRMIDKNHMRYWQSPSKEVH